LSLLFKEEQIFSSKRSELYGQTDFIANCGGLLGLFMGVSLLSIVEVVYFFTLRLICTLRMQRAIKPATEPIEPSPLFVIKAIEPKLEVKKIES
jgi:Amiloride-sensitive sodium channel